VQAVWTMEEDDGISLMSRGLRQKNSRFQPWREGDRSLRAEQWEAEGERRERRFFPLDRNGCFISCEMCMVCFLSSGREH
jgi:hypothetical protein